MNYLKSIVAQMHNLHFTQKGKTFDEAQLFVCCTLGVIAFMYIFIGFFTLIQIVEYSLLSDVINQYFSILGENSISYKLVALLSMILFGFAIRFALRPKYYNSVIEEYEMLSFEEKINVAKKGELNSIIISAFGAIWMLIFSNNIYQS